MKQAPHIKNTRKDSLYQGGGGVDIDDDIPLKWKGLLNYSCPQALGNTVKQLKHLETRAPFFFQFLTQISCPIPKNKPAPGQFCSRSHRHFLSSRSQAKQTNNDFLKII